MDSRQFDIIADEGFRSLEAIQAGTILERLDRMSVQLDAMDRFLEAFLEERRTVPVR